MNEATHTPPLTEAELDNRRRFLEKVIGALGLTSVVGMVYPLGVYLWPRAAKGNKGKSRSLQIPANEAPIGGVKFIRFLNRPAVLLRPNEQEIVALSAVCTHLGCVVKWVDAAGEFHCPCHGAVYDAKGNVLSGPAPKSLPAYSATLEDEYIIIKEA